MRIATKQCGQLAGVKRFQRPQVRCPCPTGDVNGIGSPIKHPWNEIGIAQTPEMMRAGIRRDILQQLKIITLHKRDIPSNGHAKTVIVDGMRTRMPCEEYLDCNVVASGQSLIERRVILNGMGHDEGETEAVIPLCLAAIVAFQFRQRAQQLAGRGRDRNSK